MDRCRWTTLARIALFAVLSVLQLFGQNTINVPVDQPTIQAAINAANPGDTVLVAPGTYYENINFLGKAITVTSSEGAQNTIIDGGYSGAVVQFVTGEPQTAILDGFTITHGSSTPGAYLGAPSGAIMFNNAAATIRNNIITANTDCDLSGVYASNSSPQVLNNTISNNGQTTTGCSAYGYGAGISITYSLPGTQTQVVGNTVINNVMAEGSGGGINLFQVGNALVQNNLIKGNSSSDTGGMNIWDYSNERVVGNVIVENYSTFGGASALYIFGLPNQPGMYVTNNTLSGGTQDEVVLHLDSTFDSVHLTNNIIVGNGTAPAIDCAQIYGSAPPSLANNDVYVANSTPGYSGICTDQTGLNGNISVDPAFLDPAHSDYHLQATSALIDAGSNIAADLPDTDIEGNPRIVDGNNDGNPVVDIGAYEFVPQSSGLSISPAWVKFPNQDVGSTSRAVVLTLTNTSTQVVGLAGIRVNGPFAQTNNCPQSLMPSGSCTIAVAFSPTTGGRVAGSLNIAASSGTVSVALVGVGNFAAASLNPGSLDFGVVLDGYSYTLNLVLRSTGTLPLTINSFDLPAPFAIASGGCTVGTTLAPGDSCQMPVQFTPTQMTAYNGVLTVTTSAPVSLTTNLTGSGGAAVLTVIPTTLSFGSQLVGTTSAAQTLFLSNAGNIDYDVSQISISGPFAQTNNCNGFLHFGTSCTILVTYTPSARGQSSGSLVISSIDVNTSPIMVPLTGTGIVPVLSVSPASLQFTQQSVGTTSAPQALAVSNTGDAGLLFSGFSVNGDFAQTNNCPATLAPNASCSIQVTFTPAAIGTRNGTLSIASNSNPAVSNVPLAGSGSGSEGTLSPATLSFTMPQLVNTTSAAQTVVLNNIGTLPLNISGFNVSDDYAQTNNCPASLAAFASCSIQVTFTPTAPGARPGTLSISSDSAIPIPALPITGTGSDQTTINVPADQPTIQAAINAAASGATVVVAPGTYVENINFNGRSITLTSSGGASSTIIDGNAAGTVVTFNQGESSGAVLNGFTIRNGRSASYAGGIEISGASPKITNNIITGNGGISGIAIDVEGGSPLIQSNTITNNVQNMGSGGGGAIYISAPAGGNSNVSVIGNTITDNHLDAGATGGGISLNYYASALIENNYIARNSAYNGGGGIGASSNASVIIVGNVITNNSSGGFDGGGFYNLGSGPVLFLNNTLFGDSAGFTGGTSEIAIGGFRTNSTFKNNIVYATSGNSISCPNGAAVVTATNNIVYFVAPATNVNYCPYLSQSNGFLFAEPGMVNPANGDFHLHGGSPAIDAGISDPNLPATDIGGTARVLDGNNDGIAVVDIGAYEFVPGAAPAGWAVLAPLGATFPNTVIGGTSPSIAFTLLNNGSAPLTVNSISVNSPFAQTNNCSAVLSVKMTCVIQVTFTPPGSGTFSGTLSVASDGASGTVTAPLSGFGGTISGTLAPVSLDFGHVTLGTASNVQQVTVTSTGTISLPIKPTTVTGPFSYVSGTCLHAVSLIPGASCTIGLTFKPTSSGTASGTLSIISNNPPTTPTAVTLSGVGDPVISVTPSTLSFGNQLVGITSSSQMVVLTNSGTAAINIASLSTVSPFAQTNNCGTSLAPGANCNINITFAPTARGSISGSLIISTNAPGSPATVSLTGTGIAPIASVTPTTVTFGSQLVGTTSSVQSVALSNTGDAALSISSIAASPSFAQTNNCGASLAIGASCTINVTFSPGVTGVLSGGVTVNVGAPGTSQLVAVSGTGIAPVAGISPTTVTFASQTVGTTSAPQTITLSNTGDAALSIGSIAVPASFTQTNNCGTSLAAGSTCAISVTFAPTSSGATSGTLTVNLGAPATNQSVTLIGTSVAALASVSPSSLTFTTQRVSTASPPQVVSLFNTGTATLTISSILANASTAFAQTNNCPATLAPGSGCAISVTFAPVQTGPFSGSITITDDSGGTSGSIQQVSLTGTGGVSTVAFSPSSLSFGITKVGTSSAASAVTLSNTGTMALNISSFSLSGDFSQSNNCGSLVAPGGTCTVNVVFTPTALGSRASGLTINSDAQNGNTLTVPLSGIGGGSLVTVSPSSVTFGTIKVGTNSASAAVSISNGGTTPLNFSSISLSGDFSQSNNCGSSVAAGTSCVVNVVFTPTTTGSRSGTLTINDDAQNSTAQIVALSGTGAMPVAIVSPGSLTFATTAVGTQSASSSVTLSNSGAVSMNIASITTTGDYIQSNNCPSTLAANSSCTIGVSFAPSASGTRPGILTIADDAPGGSQTVSLSGSATDFSVVLSPTSVSINPGQNANYNAKVSAIGGAYNQAVSLSCSGLPAGATCTLSPTSVVPGSSSQTSKLRVTTSNGGGTPAGTYTIIVTGVVNNAVRSGVTTLIVK